MDKKLHIICLDIPFPANYGGAIDQYYKIKALHHAGCDITLHCFQYGDRQAQDALSQLCKKVYYYPRKTGLRGLHHSLPYIVSSRQNSTLLKRLNEDQSSILFEGVHTTFYLNHPSLRLRKKIIRIHNIETDYYKQLGTRASDFLKKMYYFFESGRLHAYEKMLYGADQFLSISTTEYHHFKKLYPSKKHIELTAFHAHDKVYSLSGLGDYCLYHGNLEVEENREAVQFLATQVFDSLPFRLIIAGRNPSNEVNALKSKNIQIIANPNDKELNQLLLQAQVHVLPSFQNTGFKLKLIHSLYTARHILCNDAILEGSGLRATVNIANTAKEFKTQITQLMTTEFTEEDVVTRNQLVIPYNNANLAIQLMDILD